MDPFNGYEGSLTHELMSQHYCQVLREKMALKEELEQLRAARQATPPQPQTSFWEATDSEKSYGYNPNLNFNQNFADRSGISWTTNYPEDSQDQQQYNCGWIDSHSQQFQHEQFNQEPALDPSFVKSFLDEMKAIINTCVYLSDFEDSEDLTTAENTEMHGESHTSEIRIWAVEKVAYEEEPILAEEVADINGEPLPVEKVAEIKEEPPLFDHISEQLSVLQEVAKAEETPSLVEEVAEAKELPSLITEVAEAEEKPSLFEDVTEEEKVPQETTQNAIVVKPRDPRRFTLSVEMNGKTLSICLHDIGSSIFLTPYFAAKSLGITTDEPVIISPKFADQSRKRPFGTLGDLSIVIPASTDSVILRPRKESKDSILPDRPFLCTAGAVINVQKRKQTNLHLKRTGTRTKGDEVPFDPGDGKLRYLLDYPPKSEFEKDKWLVQSLFKESEVFAGTPRSGPDILNFVHLFVAEHHPKRRKLQAGRASIRMKIPFDPGAGKLKCSPNNLLRFSSGKTVEKCLFEETDMFAGTPRSGPDKPDLNHSSVFQPSHFSAKRMQADSCTGLGSVTRPPDISQN